MRRIIEKLAAVALSSVLAMVLCLAPATVVMAAAKSWNSGDGFWSSGFAWFPSGVPGAGDAVTIGPFGNGFTHTITYDYTGAAVTLGSLKIDDSGATTTTFTMPANNLSSNTEWIGVFGRGKFDQSGGVNTIVAGAGFLDVGVFAGSTGTYNLSGSGSLVANTNQYIGDVGTGVFNQTGGSNSINGLGNHLFLGYNALGASGTYTLSAGTLAVNNGIEYVGYKVPGTFNQSGGTNTTTELVVGVNSTGAYNLSGTGALSANSHEYVGGSGTGTFNQTGGSNTINAAGHNLYLGATAGGASGTYTLSAGSLTVTEGFEYVGYEASGTFNQSGGTNTADRFFVSNSSSSAGTYNLSGTGLLTANLSLTVGSTGSFNQSGGTVNVGGNLVIGTSSAPTATYTLSAGNLVTTNSEFIGNSGSGAFIQTGGTNSTRDLDLIGGTYTLSGTGVLTVSNSLTLFGGSPGTSPGLVNLSGGTINVGALNFGGVPAHLNWTSGKLNLTNNVVWDSAAAATSTSAAFGAALPLGSAQTLQVTGNETLGGTGLFALSLNNGSTHAVTGALTIAANGTLTQNAGSALSYSGLIQAGGTWNGTLQNQTSFTYQSGLFTGRLVNNGAVSVGSNFAPSNGVENNTTMTVAAGQTLTASGAGLDNRGSFVLAGGTLSGAGPTVNTGIIGGHGTIATPLTNTGALAPENGILNVTTAFTNSGEIFLAGGLASLSGVGAITNTGLVRGDGKISKAVNNNASGEIRAELGKRIKLEGVNAANAGKINLQGGTAEFSQPLTNGSAGQIDGRGMLITGGAGLTNNGHIALSSGFTDVFGDVNNATGSATKGITISGNADVTFWDDVTNGAGSLFRVSSGSSATFFGAFGGAGISGTGNIYFESDITPGFSPASVDFAGSVTLDATANLKIELGGTSPGGQFDQVHVAGQFSLGGTLQVALINGYSPLSGQSFDILDWGNLSGTFSTLQLPALAGGLMWDTSKLYTAGVLSIGLPGDFNGNGIVDAADYIVWRKGLGTTYAQNDYNVWRANFGQTAGSGAGASANAAVPEPTTLVLLTLATAGWSLLQRRSK